MSSTEPPVEPPPVVDDHPADASGADHRADPAAATPAAEPAIPAPPPKASMAVPLAVALTMGVVAIAIALSTRYSGTPTTTRTVTVGASQTTVVDTARRAASDPTALGAADAPVVMVEYSDFSCPYCASFAANTEKALIDKYVDEGTLRIEWRDFPYLKEESRLAALGARAAAKQGKFWQFHDALFATMHAKNATALDADVLARIAVATGLDGERFVADLTADSTAAAVSTDFSEGQRIGVSGTPAFVINGKPLTGAQPQVVFEQAIEAAAAAAK